jgi:hypothetical protein
MTLEYAVRIERLAESDGGGYLATVPDLPGCMSDGVTPEDALKNVQEASAHGSKPARNGRWKFRSLHRLWRGRGDACEPMKAAAIAAVYAFA